MGAWVVSEDRAREGPFSSSSPSCLALAGCAGGGTASTTASPTTLAAADSGARPGVERRTPSGKGAYRDITPEELSQMLRHKDFLLINTHIPYQGEIEPTDLFLPYDRAAELVSKLPADKGAKIVVYCRSDRMSTIAATVWADMGYTNLYQLVGGFEAWEAQGLPLVHRSTPPPSS